jgi:hypothetical protein
MSSAYQQGLPITTAPRSVCHIRFVYQLRTLYQNRMYKNKGHKLLALFDNCEPDGHYV